MKTGTLDQMKFKLLMRDLGESMRGTAGILEVLWQRACKDCPRGDIGRFSNDEIAVMADYQGDADTLVAALVARGWLDQHDEYRLLIHDWHDHAPNWVKALVKRLGGFYSSPPLCVSDPESVTHSASPPSQVKSSQAKPPPPTPSEPNGSAPAPEPLGPEWAAVAAELATAGMGDADFVCESARGRSATPTDVRNLLRHWLESPGAWSVGLLHSMVKNIRPDMKPSWPPPNPTYQRQKSSKERVLKINEQGAKRIRDEAERKRNFEERQKAPLNMLSEFEKATASRVIPISEVSDV